MVGSTFLLLGNRWSTHPWWESTLGNTVFGAQSYSCNRCSFGYVLKEGKCTEACWKGTLSESLHLAFIQLISTMPDEWVFLLCHCCYSFAQIVDKGLANTIRTVMWIAKFAMWFGKSIFRSLPWKCSPDRKWFRDSAESQYCQSLLSTFSHKFSIYCKVMNIPKASGHFPIPICQHQFSKRHEVMWRCRVVRSEAYIISQRNYEGFDALANARAPLTLLVQRQVVNAHVELHNFRLKVQTINLLSVWLPHNRELWTALTSLN